MDLWNGSRAQVTFQFLMPVFFHNMFSKHVLCPSVFKNGSPADSHGTTKHIEDSNPLSGAHFLEKMCFFAGERTGLWASVRGMVVRYGFWCLRFFAATSPMAWGDSSLEVASKHWSRATVWKKNTYSSMNSCATEWTQMQCTHGQRNARTRFEDSCGLLVDARSTFRTT